MLCFFPNGAGPMAVNLTSPFSTCWILASSEELEGWFPACTAPQALAVRVMTQARVKLRISVVFLIFIPP
jgi:hypothetical protein